VYKGARGSGESSLQALLFANLDPGLVCLTLTSLNLEGVLTLDQVGHGLNFSRMNKGSELEPAPWAELALG
jgi:hypothetical protein